MAIVEMTLAQLRRRGSSKWRQHGETAIGAGLAEMDFHVAPAIQQCLLEHARDERYGYAPRGPQGTMTAVVNAFVRRAASQFGWTVAPEDCQLVIDLLQGSMACVQAFAGRGEGVVVQVPSYPPFLFGIEQSGRKVVANPMRDSGTRHDIDFAHLAAALTPDTRMVLFCHPHNPTGRVFTRSELLPLRDLVLKHDLVIASDEIHADLVYAPLRHRPLALLLPEIADRIVTLYSPTKSFNFPGLRCGVMHFGSPALKKRFTAEISEWLLGTPSVPGMEATIAAWNECQPWCDQLVTYLQGNRDLVMRRLAAEAPALRVYAPEATYLAWIECSQAIEKELSPYEYFLEKAGVGLGDGRTYGPGYEKYVRLNFATSRDILNMTIDRIVAA